MSSDAYKYWASNRGWISTKFSVKNPVSHFLNLYKKKQPQSKSQKDNGQQIKYFTAQKRKMPTSHTQKVANTQKKVSIQPQPVKPQTAPHNYTINSCIFLGEQIQKKSKTIQHPKRNRSLHVKKAKKLQEDIKGLREINTAMTKIKEENETSNYSQKNFKATNCGRYKRQMMYLQPQIRASTASMKLNTSIKTHEQFERRKTTIYKQINKSMDVDMKIRQMQQYHRSTSVTHYQPIQYMTEYGYEQGMNQEVREGNSSAFTGKEWGQTFRRKPNLSVLRNKLNLHYKKSGYKEKISSVVEGEMQDLSFDAWD